MLSLPRPLINKILAHAQKNPTVEICGLIGCDERGDKNYYAIDNISENPSCRFLMDAPQQINAQKKMREKKQTLFAIVHSHPDAEATPSLLDIEENNYKDVYYIIISLNTKGVLEMRAFNQRSDGMNEIDLKLDEE